MGDAASQLTSAESRSEISLRLEIHRRAWRAKPGLRAVYEDYYRRVLAATCDGPILEIGGGTGNFKSFAPDILSADIQFAPWLDFVADAQLLPVPDGSIGALVLIDVLHHIERPRRFFDEALRALRPGGRVILLDPAITMGSWPFYALLHPEPVDLSDDPLSQVPPTGGRDPWDANQAIPTILFARQLQSFERAYPELRVFDRQWFSFLAYPLSGGFRSWSLLPGWLAEPLIDFENRLQRLLGRVAGFRLMVVLEKTG